MNHAVLENEAQAPRTSARPDRGVLREDESFAARAGFGGLVEDVLSRMPWVPRGISSTNRTYGGSASKKTRGLISVLTLRAVRILPFIPRSS
jgi:hypothetical protein